MIRLGRLVFVIGGQESQTSSRDHQARVYSDQKVLMMARREAGSHKRRPNSRTTLSQAKAKRNYSFSGDDEEWR